MNKIMKRSFVFLCCLFLMMGGLFAQGIVFEQGTWDEVLAKAKKENKVVFVDVYTSWCAPCKMVAKNVFPQEKIGNYYNQHFINYQLDGEKGNGPEVVKKYGIKGYPTFLYLDGNGNLLYCFSGAKEVKGFLEEAEKVTVCARYGGWEKMQADYKSGSSDPVFLKDYYELAGNDLKPEALNRYLKALPDDKLFTPEVGKMMDEDISLYDYDLLMRLVKGRVEMGEQDADFDFLFTFPLQWKLTKLFNESIDKGEQDRFSEVMALKRVYGALPGSLDGDVNMIWGRGLYFMSENMLNLCYLAKNKNDDARYKVLLESYLSGIMKEYPLDTLAQFCKSSEDMIAKTPELLSLLGDNLAEKYEMFGSSLIDWTDYYWRLVPSDKTNRERCAAWVKYACEMNPYNAVIPVKAAALLVRLNYKKDAMVYLEKAIEKQRFLQGDHPEKAPTYLQAQNQKTMKSLEDMLRDVKNDKI